MQEPTILFQDDAIVVIDKPAGLIVHPAHTSEVGGETVASWVLEHFPDVKDVGEPHQMPDGTIIHRPGIVHRIDRDTSGVLVIARTQQVYVRLKKQFAEREVKKAYRAFVHGAMKDERGIIDKPIGRGRGSGSHRSARAPHGMLREARTMYRTLTVGADKESGSAASYLEVMPQTGRTHQIRVHLASIQRPVVCDSLYAPGQPPILGFERLALHAYGLTFTHPLTGKEVSFQAPLPPDFLRAEKLLEKK